MSRPDNLTPEESKKWNEAMRSPVLKGTVIVDGKLKFKTLEDSTAHGCPWVEILEPGQTNYKKGDKTTRTLYLHYGIMEYDYAMRIESEEPI